MADKYIIGGRCSGKSYMTLNTIEVMLENKKLKDALKAKEQECEELKKNNCEQCKHLELYMKLKATLTEIKEIMEQGVKIHDDIIVSKQILQKCEVLNDK